MEEEDGYKRVIRTTRTLNARHMQKRHRLPASGVHRSMRMDQLGKFYNKDAEFVNFIAMWQSSGLQATGNGWFQHVTTQY